MGKAKQKRQQRALERCRQQLDEVKSQFEEVGFVMKGSVVRRTKKCGCPGCRCHRGPEYEHGPYYQWTRKVSGKTITTMLTPAEARLYSEWIKNGRHLRRMVEKMYRISSRSLRYLVDELEKK